MASLKSRRGIIKNQDVASTTFVVGKDTTVADFLTIQQALDNLPAEGGSIGLLQGTYNIDTTLTLPDKPVKIIGAGRGATVIDLGSNAIAAFTIAVGFAKAYEFRSFRINGDSTVGQIAFSDSAVGTVDTVIVDDVQVGSMDAASGLIEKIFSPVPAQLIVSNCDFASPNLATSLLFDGGGTVSAHRVNHIGRGGSSASINLTATNCDFEASNGWVLAVVRISSTRFIAADGAGTITLSGSVRSKFSGCSFQDCILSLTSGASSSFVGCSFLHVLGAVEARWIDLAAISNNVTISGCVFDKAATAEAVRIASDNCVVTGNFGCKVTETGTADNNRYSNNEGFDGSTIIGADSVVDDWNTRTVTTTPVTLDRDDRTVDVDASGGVRLVNLPTAASARYQIYTIRKLDSSTNAVTIDANGAETINGNTTVVLNDQFAAIRIQSTGTTWIILAKVTAGYTTLQWRPDNDTAPTRVQLTKLTTFEIKDGDVKGVIESIETPRDLSLLTNPTVQVQIAVTGAGTGTGNVEMRLTARYIAATELASKAADETLTITAPVATNTLQAVQADIVFTLDASLIADSDEINLFLERVGDDVADTFDGDIGIVETSRMDYLKN